jgi:hypothetical protein
MNFQIRKLSDYPEAVQDKLKQEVENQFSLAREQCYPEFNDYGLRYKLEALNYIGNTILVYPLEIMADFVDAITKAHVDENAISEDLWGCDGYEYIPGSKVNATGCGNLAYMAVHHQDEVERERALVFLQSILDANADNIKQSLAAIEQSLSETDKQKLDNFRK